MASPVISNCIQIRLLWTVDANLAINVLNTSCRYGPGQPGASQFPRSVDQDSVHE